MPTSPLTLKKSSTAIVRGIVLALPAFALRVMVCRRTLDWAVSDSEGPLDECGEDRVKAVGAGIQFLCNGRTGIQRGGAYDGITLARCSVDLASDRLMALQVVSFATYLTNSDGVIWRRDDYNARDFVLAIKDRDVCEDAFVRCRGQWRRFENGWGGRGSRRVRRAGGLDSGGGSVRDAR
jgi:hypothetical protein